MLDRAMLAIRTILLNGLLDEVSGESARMQLSTLASLDPESPVRLYVSSPGGDLAAGLSLAQAVASAGCPVWTLCVGQARGVALLVAACGRPGRRYALPHAYLSLELRPPPTAVDLPPAAWRPDDAAFTRLRGLVAGELALRSGRPRAGVEADLAAGRVLTPEHAVAYGLVDHVVRSTAEIRA